MPFYAFVAIPTFIGVLAFIVGLLDQVVSPALAPVQNLGFAFISFQAWAVYFFAGCSLQGGVKAYTNYLMGIVAAITIILIAQNSAPFIGRFASPFALCVGCIIFLSLERVPMFSLLPPMFISAGMFFGLITYMPNATLASVSAAIAIYSLLGLFCGYLTILFRTWYEQQYAQKHSSKASIPLV
jgi:hypothetical protein